MVPWAERVSLIEPYAPQGGRRGQQPFSVQNLLRIHFCSIGSSPGTRPWKKPCTTCLPFGTLLAYRIGTKASPNESSILRFRHLLERYKLADQILATVNLLLQAKGLQLKAVKVVDATRIAAPSSTKNQSGELDPEMHQSKKGNQWYCGMKAHIGVNADSGCGAQRAAM